MIGHFHLIGSSVKQNYEKIRLHVVNHDPWMTFPICSWFGLTTVHNLYYSKQKNSSWQKSKCISSATIKTAIELRSSYSINHRYFQVHSHKFTVRDAKDTPYHDYEFTNFCIVAKWPWSLDESSLRLSYRNTVWRQVQLKSYEWNVRTMIQKPAVRSSFKNVCTIFPE